MSPQPAKVSVSIPGRHIELAGHVPTRLIEKQDGVASRRDILGDFIEMQLHRLGVAPRQDQADHAEIWVQERSGSAL